MKQQLWTHTCRCGVKVNAAEPPQREFAYSCPGCGKEVTVKPPAPAKEK
jgi:DNA-directed RNA polymerase subunit RPC12/RpoP